MFDVRVKDVTIWRSWQGKGTKPLIQLGFCSAVVAAFPIRTQMTYICRNSLWRQTPYLAVIGSPDPDRIAMSLLPLSRQGSQFLIYCVPGNFEEFLADNWKNQDDWSCMSISLSASFSAALPCFVLCKVIHRWFRIVRNSAFSSFPIGYSCYRPWDEWTCFSLISVNFQSLAVRHIHSDRNGTIMEWER